jgi:hypothetical protein
LRGEAALRRDVDDQDRLAANPKAMAECDKEAGWK